MIKEILLRNDRAFVNDVKRVREVLAYSPSSGTYLKVRKKEVLEEAAVRPIKYYITDKIFRVKRDTMVIT